MRQKERYQDPIWLIMKNPLFAEKINKLICSSREKWEALERRKVILNPFYKPVACPVTLDAITWISAYLRYYFLYQKDEDGNDNGAALDDLVRIFDILIHRFEGTLQGFGQEEVSKEGEDWEADLYA